MKAILTVEEFKLLSKAEQSQYISGMESLKEQTKSIEQDETALTKLTMPAFKEMIGDIMKHYIDQMTKVDKKFNAFPGIGKVNDDTSEAGKFAKSAKFLRALVCGDVQTAMTISNEARVKANLSEASTTAGGFLVPEEFSNEILRLAPEYGVARSNCRHIPMRRDVLSIPGAGSTEQSAIWISEAAVVKQTDPNFKQIQLVTSKLGALPKFTNELLEDEDSGLMSYMSMLIAEAFAQEEDNQAFRGTGSPFIGVCNSSGAPNFSQVAGTSGALSYPDLVKMTGLLYSNATAGAKWYFHRTIIAEIRSKTTSTGAPFFGAGADNILGYPLVSTEKMPSNTAMGASSGSVYGVFGDLRRGYAFGDRGTITMKVSTEATVDSDNLFEQDMVALRAIERIAMATLIPSAFVLLKSA